MNVSKAMNLTILFFVILNVVLYSMIYVSESKYQISDKQQRDITTLLSDNKISLYSKLLTSYKPLRQIRLSQEYMKPEFVIAWLFDENETVLEKEEFDRVIYSAENKMLNFDYKQYLFEDGSGGETIDLSMDTAKLLCERKLAELNVPELKFELDNSFDDAESGSITLEYRMSYENIVVYTSFVKFKVSSSGIVQMKIALYAPLGYIDSSREIYSSDEALLALMYELKSIYGDVNIIIMQLDLIYYSDGGRNDEISEIKGVPCYRVYIADRLEPFLINTYFNTFIN